MRKNTLIAILIICSASNCFSQDDGCLGCNDALKIVQNTILKKSNTTNDQATSTMFNYSYDYWRNYSSQSNHTTEGDAGYALFSASFSTSGFQLEQEQKFETMRTSYKSNTTLSTTDYQFLYQNTTDPKVLKIWLECMVNNCGNGPFIEKKVVTDVDFIVHMGWRIKDALASNLKSSITVVTANCTFKKGDLKSGAMFSPKNPLIGAFQKIDKNQPASVSIVVAGFPGKYSAEIPASSLIPVEPKFKSFQSVPAGTIIAFGGAKIPEGWLVCDGSVKNSSEFGGLYLVLGSIWGAGDGTAGSFNLPDLRGVFLRGVDGSATNDPEHNSRLNQSRNIVVGNTVGSFQKDNVGSHKHSISRTIQIGEGTGNFQHVGGRGNEGYANGMNTDLNAPDGAETRPKNAYVFYIIKS